MKAVILLADAAQSESGKTHALGLGWNVTGLPTPPMALVVLIDVPWNETNTKHKLTIDLVDADGKVVSLGQGPLGAETLHLEAEFEAGRPPGIPPGSPIRSELAINIGPGLPLVPGQNYEFRMKINGKSTDSWLASFLIRPN